MSVPNAAGEVRLDERAVQLCAILARGAAVGAALVGLVGLLGWMFDNSLLKGVFSHGITMKANSAVCLLLAGVALLLLSPECPTRRGCSFGGRVCAIIVAVIGGLTLSEHLVGWNLGIDQLLFTEPPGAPATASPGRMGPPAASSFLLAGISLLLLNYRSRRGRAPSQYMAIMIGLIVSLSVIGYAYNVQPLYSISRYTGIAIHTASGILLLAMGILCARPGVGLMSVINAEDAGGMMARRLLVPAVLVPFFFGLLRTVAERREWVDSSLGRPLLVLSLIVTMASLVVWNARSMGILAREQAKAEAAKRSAEEATTDAAQRLRLAIDAAHLGHWEYFPLTGVNWFSAEFAGMLGIGTSETRGHVELWKDRIHPDDKERVLARVRESLDNASPYEVEYRVRAPDGAVRWIASKGKVIKDASGQTVRLVGIASDITERKQAEAELHAAKEEAEAASKAKDQFLAVLSHELRTPLTPVLAIVQMMEADPRISPETRDLARVVRRNVELEARLIDDLLDLTRISRGKIELQLATVDVHDKIRHVLEICEPEIHAKQIKLTTHLQAANHHVRADPPRLQQIFWNIVKNAVKFTPKDGTITVTTSNTPDGRLETRVTDSGVGIPREMLPRIFDAFEQGGPIITRQFGGLGLGLTISKALTDLHGGGLSAESEGAGHGSTFILVLPTAPADTMKDHPAVRDNGDTIDSGMVLLVEDHPDTANAMARILRSFGYNVTVADSVQSALSAVSGEQFDIVISDLGLPDGSGHDLLRQIMQQQPVKAIALSGFGMEEDLKKSREAGFAAHLTKPVNIAQLQQTLRRVTQEAAPE